MNILLVEDSATLRHKMCSYITTAGHKPVVTSSGEEALQILEHTPFDMVIMDVEMPGLDGFETTRLIRESYDNWIPIIFVTGKNDDVDFRDGIEVGGDDYLIKPVSEIILHAKIRAMERIINMRDQLNSLNRELVELSERDGLTKLYNRRTFDERASELWRQATRTKEPLSILIMDIDHFKDYNDYYGHQAGDECIIKVAHTIRASLSRPTDLLARYGGEEFIILLPDTHEDGAYHVAERIRESIWALNIPHRASPTHNKVSISIGGAVVSHTAGTRMHDQVNAADKALYVSKQNGRNRVTIRLFSPNSVVLVAENETAITTSIEGKLARHCAIMQAHNPEEAAELAMCNRPDLVIVDTDLCGGQGPATIKAIRENSITDNIPIILIGGHPVLTSVVHGVNTKDLHFPKPLDHQQFIRKLNELLIML